MVLYVLDFVTLHPLTYCVGGEKVEEEKTMGENVEEKKLLGEKFDERKLWKKEWENS